MRSIIIFILVILANVLFVLSCRDNVLNPASTCKSVLIEHFEMQPYQGEEIGCRNFISLFEYQNEHFASYDNYCADFEKVIVVSCEGPKVYNSLEVPFVNNVLSNGTNLGVIGIDPE